MSSIFDAGESAEGPRVRLGAMTSADLEAMEPWVAGALAPEWGIEDLQRAVEAEQAVLIRDEADVAIGLAVVLLDAPEKGAACVPFISIEPPRRFRGLGGEAGLALERHLRRKLGIEKVFALVPDGRGLAVYFWLRLGYRPLTGSESPGPLVGLGKGKVIGMWMVRDGE